MIMVYAYYRYEDGIAGLWSIHKTMDGAAAEMRKHKEDGFIMEYNLHD